MEQDSRFAHLNEEVELVVFFFLYCSVHNGHIYSHYLCFREPKCNYANTWQVCNSMDLFIYLFFYFFAKWHKDNLIWKLVSSME